MGKFRFRAYLDRPLFALLIVVGAFVSGIFEVRSEMDLLAATSEHATTVPATAASGTQARVSL